MSTLKQFSDKERAYDAYQARQNYLRMQGSIERRQRELVAALADERAALAQERAAREAAVQEKEAERRAKEGERQAKETERLAKEAERLAKEAALQEIEAERQAEEAERQAKEAECQAKEAALAEITRLQALLRGDLPSDRKYKSPLAGKRAGDDQGGEEGDRGCIADAGLPFRAAVSPAGPAPLIRMLLVFHHHQRPAHLIPAEH